MAFRYALFVIAIASIALAGCIQPPEGNGNAPNGTPSAPVVEEGDTVTVEYRGELRDGTVFDASENHGSPLTFTAGAGEMISGFDSAVLGMRQGEEKTVTLPPTQAYGSIDESKIVELPKSQFSEPENLVPGLPVSSPDGPQGTIQEIREEAVVVNFNHPLAGQTLTFWIKVVGIEKP